MIINMTGGANPLNFKVVCGSVQPAAPAENTLWVNTPNPVAAWVFSANEPEQPLEGTVWFSCSTAAKTPFNALKSNGLMVYPSKCSQYISSAWQSREAMIYKDGAWLDWFVYLYSHGDECDSVSGGWSSFRNNNITASTAQSLSLSGTGKNDAESKGALYTANQIDLTNFESIEAVGFFAQKTSGAHPVWGLTKTKPSNASNVTTAANNMAASSTSKGSIDISNLTGGYYVVFIMEINGSVNYSGSIGASEVILK